MYEVVYNSLTRNYEVINGNVVVRSSVYRETAMSYARQMNKKHPPKEPCLGDILKKATESNKETNMNIPDSISFEKTSTVQINFPQWVMEAFRGNKITAIKLLIEETSPDSKGYRLSLSMAKTIVDSLTKDCVITETKYFNK